MNFLERYKAGQHREVWDELIALESKVFEPPYHAEAVAVAEETMRRVKVNLEVVAGRLHLMGFDHKRYPDNKVRNYALGLLQPPKNKVSSQIASLKRKVGAIPISLEVFWRVVGEADFVGYLPNWPEYSDPIVIYSVEGALEEYPNWLDLKEHEEWAEEPYRAPIAPDDYHKDNVSGGMFYNIVLPNAAADALLEDTPYDLMFVEYLRFSLLEWGGFPGLKNDPRGEEIAQHLISGLIPF